MHRIQEPTVQDSISTDVSASEPQSIPKLPTAIQTRIESLKEQVILGFGFRDGRQQRRWRSFLFALHLWRRRRRRAEDLVVEEFRPAQGAEFGDVGFGDREEGEAAADCFGTFGQYLSCILRVEYGSVSVAGSQDFFLKKRRTEREKY